MGKFLRSGADLGYNRLEHAAEDTGWQTVKGRWKFSGRF
jgi:hypothetical protein